MRKFFTAFLLMAALAIVLVVSVNAASPRSFSFQGRLTDAGGSPVADGVYVVDFSIYNSAVGGAWVWGESGINVSTVDGLFTTQLGSNSNPINSSNGEAFDSLFVEIVVGGETLTPRTYLQATGHALTAGGLNVWSSSFGVRSMRTYSNGSRLSTYGLDGLEQIRLWGESWGEMYLYNGSVSNPMTAMLTSQMNGPNTGGGLVLYGDDGSTDVRLAADQIGDNAAVLPPSSVNADEMLNEPGFSYARLFHSANLDNNNDMEDLVTTTITTPADGYIVVHGIVNMYFNLTNQGLVFGYFDIDTVTGGNSFGSGPTWQGSSIFAANAVNESRPCVLTRVFNVPAGTYELRLKGEAYSGNEPGSVVYVEDAEITATYFPTSYGSVVMPVASNDGYDDATPLAIKNRVTGESKTAYQVDLRELELKAKEARIAALNAELALEKAKSEALLNQTSQVSDDKIEQR